MKKDMDSLSPVKIRIRSVFGPVGPALESTIHTVTQT